MGHNALSWKPTKIMNMRDLAKDDDFLSHMLVEKLGNTQAPLVVHKMDPSRRLPKTNAQDLLNIVRRLVISKVPLQQAVREAVDNILILPAIRYYLKDYTQQQINAFATHATRYFELYHPSGSIEIAHTSRYSHRTGKSELCILATRFLAPGTVITELKGSMANLSDEEDRELKHTNTEIRRDFSVIHSKSMKKNHLFLGPARFVNHDCENNCELFREGRYITFRVLKPIKVGDEITAHYGDGYFGRRNRHCLCETCERLGRGGYAQDDSPSDSSSSDDGDDSGSDSDTSSSDGDDPVENPPKPVNLDERRTRRGVYAVVQKQQPVVKTEESDHPLIELVSEHETPSDLTSLRGSTPHPAPASQASCHSSPQSTPRVTRTYLTRRQSALSRSSSKTQLVTPPLSEGTASTVSSKKGKQKASPPEVIRIKEEEVEPHLKEPSTSDAVDQPLGPDGKPLPVCSTCSNVMPIISVNSEVVWNGSSSTSKKKKTKEECPRCMRHFSIFGQPWPRRVPLPGTVSFLPTPREETKTPESPSKRTAAKIVSTLDRKLSKVGRPTNVSKEERPLKKCKITPASAPVTPAKPISHYRPILESESSPTKRRRGRPRLSSLPLIQVKREEESISLNGRPAKSPSKSDKKLTSSSSSPLKWSPKRPQLSRAERASEREKQRAVFEKELESQKNKRSAPEEEPDLFDDRPRKLLKVHPRPATFKASRLFHKPNPLSFALEAWGGPLVPDSESSDDDESGPVTPEDLSAMKGTRSSLKAVNSFAIKPSPFHFARRRWSTKVWTDNAVDDTLLVDSLSAWSTVPDLDSEEEASTGNTQSLHQRYPNGPTERTTAMKQSVRFSASQSSAAPSLVGAGWDSGSDC